MIFLKLKINSYVLCLMSNFVECKILWLGFTGKMSYYWRVVTSSPYGIVHVMHEGHSLPVELWI